jgi:hypothetical protein
MTICRQLNFNSETDIAASRRAKLLEEPVCHHHRAAEA